MELNRLQISFPTPTYTSNPATIESIRELEEGEEGMMYVPMLQGVQYGVDRVIKVNELNDYYFLKSKDFAASEQKVLI